MAQKKSRTLQRLIDARSFVEAARRERVSDVKGRERDLELRKAEQSLDIAIDLVKHAESKATTTKRRDYVAENAVAARKERVERAIQVPEKVRPQSVIDRQRDAQDARDAEFNERERQRRNDEAKANRIAYLRGGGKTRWMTNVSEAMRAVNTFARSARVQAPQDGIEIGTAAYREFESFREAVDKEVRRLAGSRLAELQAEMKDAEADRQRLIDAG